MSDSSLHSEIEEIRRSHTMPAARATEYLFRQYRIAVGAERDAFVLALIGVVVTATQRRLCSEVANDAAGPDLERSAP